MAIFNSYVSLPGGIACDKFLCLCPKNLESFAGVNWVKRLRRGGKNPRRAGIQKVVHKLTKIAGVHISMDCFKGKS